MDFQAHNTKMVAHFIWLEQRNPEYAKESLNRYRTHPDCPNPQILTDIKAEKARRLTQPTPESHNSSSTTDPHAPPTTSDR